MLTIIVFLVCGVIMFDIPKQFDVHKNNGCCMRETVAGLVSTHAMTVIGHGGSELHGAHEETRPATVSLMQQPLFL